jgi:Protein of unknown function (DUF3553)
VLNLPKVKPMTMEATMKFVTGQRLKVREKPDWGIGEVQSVLNDEKILVCFEGYGQRELTLIKWHLVLVEGEEAKSVRLDRLLAWSQNPRTAPHRARRFGKGTGSSQTTPIAGNPDFLELSDALHTELIKRGLSRQEFKGSHSWVPAAGSSNETWFKLCHYGFGQNCHFRFGIRDHLMNEAIREACPDEFAVPPAWDASFCGFEVRNSKESIERVHKSLHALQHDNGVS